MRQHSSADQQANSPKRAIGFLAAIFAVCLVALAVILVVHRRAGDAVGSPQSAAEAVASDNHPQSSAIPGETSKPVNAAGLSADFSEFSRSLPAGVGLAAVAVGGDGAVLSMGEWESGPAWSTSKVPLVLAKLQEEQDHNITPAMRAAITQSDNGSAKDIWASMGTPQEAAAKMEKVLRAVGDPTAVEYRETRAAEGYTAFGQTNWSLANQASFMSGIACDPRAIPLLDLMAEVEQDQRWGLGTIAGTRFKGGWGPSTSGEYLVRQVGLVPTPKGTVAVAIAAEPNMGRGAEGLANGERALDAVAGWIESHIGELPAGSCK